MTEYCAAAGSIFYLRLLRIPAGHNHQGPDGFQAGIPVLVRRGRAGLAVLRVLRGREDQVLRGGAGAACRADWAAACRADVGRDAAAAAGKLSAALPAVPVLVAVLGRAEAVAAAVAAAALRLPARE